MSMENSKIRMKSNEMSRIHAVKESPCGKFLDADDSIIRILDEGLNQIVHTVPVDSVIVELVQ